MDTQTASRTADYGSVITAEDYVSGINEHPDIPQSDAGICRLVERHAKQHEARRYYVLEVGCGPGRITGMLKEAAIRGLVGRGVAHVLGIDRSAPFIEEAKKESGLDFICEDFLEYEFEPQMDYDAIVIQGVMHHVPADQKQAWLQKCRNLLRAGGILIVGDEFIADHRTPLQREHRAALFYAYVVASALRAGHQSLADIETQNMIDDVASGLPGAGHGDADLRAYIQAMSLEVYMAFMTGALASGSVSSQVRSLVDVITAFAKEYAGDEPSSDRGDRKVSMEQFENDLAIAGFAVRERLLYGPVEYIGGMAVYELAPC